MDKSASHAALLGLRAAVQIMFQYQTYKSSKSNRDELKRLVKHTAKSIRENPAYGDADQRKIMADYFESALWVNADHEPGKPTLTLLDGGKS